MICGEITEARFELKGRVIASDTYFAVPKGLDNRWDKDAILKILTGKRHFRH